MSTEEVQETVETVETDEVEKHGELTPEKLGVNTDKSINASLEEIDDPEVLKAMVKKLRGENAKTRTEKNAKAKELEEFEAWKQSQMTDLEKEQAKAKALEEKLAAKTKELIVKEFGLDEDLAEFVDGTEEEMRAKAEKLASHAKRAEEASNAGGLVPDLFRQGGGKPVRPAQKDDSGGAFLLSLAETQLGG